MSEEECPHCKYKSAMHDFYYRSGEYYVSCNRCGYFEHFCPRIKGAVGYERQVHNIEIPIAAYGIYFNGAGSLGHFRTQEQLDAFISQFNSEGFVNGKGERTIVAYYCMYDEDAELYYVYELISGKKFPFSELDDFITDAQIKAAAHVKTDQEPQITEPKISDEMFKESI